MKKLALIAALLFAPASFAQIVVTSTAGGGVALGTPGPTGPAGANGSNGAPGPNCSLSSPPNTCDMSGANIIDVGTAAFGSASGTPIPSGFQFLTGYGDSLMQGVGAAATGGNGALEQLSTLLAMPAVNSGIGGTTSTQIATREGGVATTVTVSGGAIPVGPNCAVTLTWATGLEAGNNANTAAPSNLNAPAPYNNNNGANIGGLWGTIQGVQGQVVEGHWNFPGWVNDGVYTFTPLTCPASSVSVPSNSTWTPMTFTWLNGLVILEGGHNNITATGGVAKVESDFDAMIAHLPTRNRYLIWPIMYNGTWATGGAQATLVAAANTYLKTTYPSAYPMWNGQDLLQYIGSLYNASNPVDVIDHAANPLAAPSSLRAFYPGQVTLTSNITDTTSCGMTFTGYSGTYEYVTVDSENIGVTTTSTVGSTTTVTACTRGYGSTAATHTSGTVGGAEDIIHMNGTGYGAVATFLYNSNQLVTEMGTYLPQMNIQQLLANPNSSVYALQNFPNIFEQNQTLDAKGTAVSGTNYGSRDLVFNCSYWNGTAAVTQPCAYIYEQTFAGTAPNTGIFIDPLNATGTFAVQVDGNFTVANGTAATSLASQPGPPAALIGHCWTGSASAVSSTTFTPIISGGNSGLNIVTADGCSNTPILEFNGTPIGPGSAVNLNQTTPQYVQEHSNTFANADWVSFQAPMSSGNAGLAFYNNGGVSGTWNVRTLETSNANQLTYNFCAQQTTTVTAPASCRNLYIWKNSPNTSAVATWDTSSFTASNTITLQNSSGTVAWTSQLTPIRAGAWTISASTTVAVTFATAMGSTPSSCQLTTSASTATTGVPFATSLATAGFTVNVPTSGTISGTYQCVLNNAN